MTRRLLVPLVACVALSCTKSNDAGTATPASTDAPPADAATTETDAAAVPDVSGQLAAAIGGEHRSADNKARDTHRHPEQTLEFFGVRPEHHVVELWPGGGWYTEILAPYTKAGGKLTVTLYDPKGPEGYYGTRQANKMLERFAAEADVFGGVEHVVVPQTVTFKEDGKIDDIKVEPFTLGEPGSADVVLTFRNSHGWFNRGAAELVYGEAFKVLKPGGVFGVVQHRAAQGADPKQTGDKGYLPEQAVIDAVTAVGFVLDGKSEINANPKDTKDYEKGVWTLPPVLADKDKDREKYVAIGESDRMTLRFIKPEG